VGPRAGLGAVAIHGKRRDFSLDHRVQIGSGAHPASYPTGTGSSFPGIKLPGCEDDSSPPSSAEVKNAWSYASTPSTFSWRGA
jgi:hypothetical protein